MGRWVERFALIALVYPAYLFGMYMGQEYRAINYVRQIEKCNFTIERAAGKRFCIQVNVRSMMGDGFVPVAEAGRCG